jgi:hypothetical protein
MDPEPQTQGGTLTFGAATRTSPKDSSIIEETISLEGYIGEPLKAVQFQVITTGGLKVRSVQRSTAIQNSTEWNFSHMITHGNSVDTAKVVIFGMGRNALPVRAYSDLMVVTCEIAGTATEPTMSFANVLGALSRGQNANLEAGPPRILSSIKGKNK